MSKREAPNIFLQYLIHIIKTGERIGDSILYFPKINKTREKQETPNIYHNHLEHIILTGTRFGDSVLYAPKISKE
jgi:hypothetical protein